jgi:hypothetical protein
LAQVGIFSGSIVVEPCRQWPPAACRCDQRLGGARERRRRDATSRAGVELDIRLLVDHRERLVKQRTALINDLRWQLHDLWPELEIPARALTGQRWQGRLAGRLQRSEQSARVRIARDELKRIRDLTRAITTLEQDLAALVAAFAPRLLADPCCGTLTAAKLIGEIAGIQRFASDRYRLDRGGNRRLNCALYRLALNKARRDPEPQAFLARKQAEGKTRREALRALKRHLVRRVYRLLQPPNNDTHLPLRLT